MTKLQSRKCCCHFNYLVYSSCYACKNGCMYIAKIITGIKFERQRVFISGLMVGLLLPSLYIVYIVCNLYIRVCHWIKSESSYIFPRSYPLAIIHLNAAVIRQQQQLFKSGKTRHLKQLESKLIPGGVELSSIRKQLLSLAPSRFTLWVSRDGLLCLVHSAFSLQEGIRLPGLKSSTSFLVICKLKHLIPIKDLSNNPHVKYLLYLWCKTR